MAGHKKLPPARSLVEVALEIAAQWHPTKNGELSPSDVLREVHDWQTARRFSPDIELNLRFSGSEIDLRASW
jgi:hypothetical protein